MRIQFGKQHLLEISRQQDQMSTYSEQFHRTQEKIQTLNHRNTIWKAALAGRFATQRRHEHTEREGAQGRGWLQIEHMRVANERVAAGSAVEASVRLKMAPLAEHPRHRHHHALSISISSHPIRRHHRFRFPVVAVIHLRHRRRRHLPNAAHRTGRRKHTIHESRNPKPQIPPWPQPTVPVPGKLLQKKKSNALKGRLLDSGCNH